jgi:hypothetical protein
MLIRIVRQRVFRIAHELFQNEQTRRPRS